MLNVPNTITLLRILAVPVFLSLLAGGRNDAALVVFIIAGLTDAIDGMAARLMDARTELGAHLDPLADKLLLVSTYITLGFLGTVPIELVITIIIRDAVIVGGFLLAAVVVGSPMKIAPSIWGKLTTFLQIVTVSLVLLAQAGWTSVPNAVLTTLFLTTAVATAVSGIDYVVYGVRWYQTEESAAS